MNRQWEVTHIVTGEVTLVNASSTERAARRCGYYWPADCYVRVVPIGYESDLPFDEVPLIVRRANTNQIAA
jgi:hypothetical protein